MRGRILGIEPDGSGVVVSDAGARFRFGAADWRGQRPPSVGAQVDFEAVEEGARDIYPAIGAMSGLTGGIDLDALRQSASGGKMGDILRRPAALPAGAAVLSLIAFVLPALSAPELTTSLLDIDRVPALMGPAAALAGESGGLGLAESLLVFRFLSPLAAGVLIFLALTQRPMGPAPLVAGGAALFAGVLPFMIKGAIIDQVQSSAFMGAMVGESLGALILVGPGAWLSLVAGAMMIASGLGVLKNPLAAKAAA